MLGADTNELNSYFNIEIQSVSNDDDKKWKVLLTPKQIQTSHFVKDITVEGDQFVDSIQINESSTDSTFIQFSNTTVSQKLNPAELGLFGQN